MREKNAYKINFKLKLQRNNSMLFAFIEIYSNELILKWHFFELSKMVARFVARNRERKVGRQQKIHITAAATDDSRNTVNLIL